MIDDKINKSLREIELELQNLTSARRQVESTVTAYAGLTESTSAYVRSLNRVTEEIKELIKVVGEDYKERTKEFEEQQKKIENNAHHTMEAIEEASKSVVANVESTVNSLQQKLTVCIISSVLTILIVLGLHFLF